MRDAGSFFAAASGLAHTPLPSAHIHIIECEGEKGDILHLQLDPWFIVYFVLGISLLYFIGGVLVAVPGRILLRLLASAVLGAAALVGLRLIGVALPLNFLTAFITGTLGLPGVLLLLFFLPH